MRKDWLELFHDEKSGIFGRGPAAEVHMFKLQKAKRTIVFIGFLFLLAYGQTNGQEGEVWATPFLLSQNIGDQSGIPGRYSYPLLLADEWGGAHALWVTSFDQNATIGDTLFYSYWNGATWSIPRDVLYTAGEPIWIPQAALDKQGFLHLTWTDDTLGQIWYTRVSAAEAGSANAWPTPRRITDSFASGPSVAVGEDGTVHLIFCDAGNYQGVYHVNSIDSANWSRPVFVGELSNSSIEYPECRIRQTFDARGRLHVIWGQALPQQAPIYYTRSEDGGLSWFSPLKVDHKDERYAAAYAPGRPSILAFGPDEIHLIWLGSPSGQRRHQWSADGGNTWSSAEQIFPDFRGFTEPPAIVADNSGTLHLVSMGWLETKERLSGAYYTYWRDGDWAPPVLIDQRARPRSDPFGEFAALAITQGNMLHVIWNDNNFSEIWVSALEIDVPALPPQARLFPQATSTAQIVSSPTFTATILGHHTERSNTFVAAVTPIDVTVKYEFSAGQVLLISGLPAALLVGLVVLLQLKRRRN